VIRLLSGDDFEVFRRIRLEALRAEPGAYASTVEEWEILPDEEWRRRLTENPVFVALRDNEPVGIMGLMRQRSSKMAHRATIIMVFLRADLRGTGLARALLENLTEYAKAQGIRQLELAVTAENLKAFRFYRRQGFSEIGRVPGGFLHEGREIDDIMMARRIQG
jgi:RimJ/RimL family protein N-acetyltransferase